MPPRTAPATRSGFLVGGAEHSSSLGLGELPDDSGEVPVRSLH
jgi:hypothetical protein